MLSARAKRQQTSFLRDADLLPPTLLVGHTNKHSMDPPDHVELGSQIYNKDIGPQSRHAESSPPSLRILKEMQSEVVILENDGICHQRVMLIHRLSFKNDIKSSSTILCRIFCHYKV